LVFLAACRVAKSGGVLFCLRHPRPALLMTLRVTGVERLLAVEQ